MRELHEGEVAGEVLPRRGWLGPQPMPPPATGFRAWTTEERERWFATGDTPTSGRFGFVPLAPRRRRQLGAIASVAAGMGVVVLAVLICLGVVHVIQLFGAR